MPNKLLRSTKRLIIRPLRYSDYAEWCKAHFIHQTQKNEWDRKPRRETELSKKVFNELIKAQKLHRKNGTFYDFGVFRKSDGRLIGGVSVIEISRHVSQSAEIGCGLFNSYWGQGYAREAFSALFDICFRDLKLHRLESGIEPRNKRSIKMVRSLGMRREGLKKRSHYLRNHWVDLLIFALTCEDVGIKFLGPKPSLKI